MRVTILATVAMASVMAGCSGGSNGSGSAQPTQYNPVVRHVGDTWSQRTVATASDGTVTTVDTKYVVDAVTADGSASVGLWNANNVFGGTTMLAPDGLARVVQGCITTPERANYIFPLYVGKTWDSSYTEACNQQPGITASITGRVVSEESIATAAGTFLTLKTSLAHVETSRNPTTDATTTNTTCWWSVELGLFVKCERAISYATNPPPAGSAAAQSTELLYFTSGAEVPAVIPTSLNYPAITANMPKPPQLGSPLATPVVMSNPRIVPVFFPDTQNRSALLDFLPKLITSSEWDLLQEYGIGPAAVTSALDLQTNAPGISTVATDTEVRTWVLNLIVTGAAASSGVLDQNSLLLLFYPANSNITFASGATMCAGFGGYHDAVTMQDGSKIAFAVLPNCQRGLDTITLATSHEIFEAASDPDLNNGYRVVHDVGWAATYGAAELGDMCETRSDKAAIPGDIGYKIARFWSGNAAAVFHDPCVPSQAATTYFNSVPVLLDTVKLTGVNAVTGNAVGVAIARGASRTIDVHLVSDQPTGGIWHLTAHQTGLAQNEAATLVFAWDSPVGQNGDVRHLTITAPDAPLTKGAVFSINSFYGGKVTNWVGAVGN